MSWGTAALRAEQQWLPTNLLGLDRAVWPLAAAAHTVRVRDIAEWIAHAPSMVSEGSPVVVPSGVDAVTGAPSSRPARRNGPAWRFGPGGLQEGDLLVPVASAHPALLIREDCDGLAFAPTFVLVRPDRNAVLPEVLWAILNSSSGRVARLRRTELSTVCRPADVLDLEIPVPSFAEQQRIAPVATQLRTAATPTEAAVRESWWRTAPLRYEPNWSYLLSSKVPVDLTTGTPLGDLAGFTQGQQRNDVADHPATGLVPLLVHREVVRGDEPSRWTEAIEPIARPGEIVVSLMNPKSEAKAVHRDYAVGGHLLVVRPHNAGDTDRILRSLNSAPGRAARAALSTGITVATLTLANARRLPVTNSAVVAPAEPPEPLPDALERLVWR